MVDKDYFSAGNRTGKTVLSAFMALKDVSPVAAEVFWEMFYGDDDND